MKLLSVKYFVSILIQCIAYTALSQSNCWKVEYDYHVNKTFEFDFSNKFDVHLLDIREFNSTRKKVIMFRGDTAVLESWLTTTNEKLPLKLQLGSEMYTVDPISHKREYQGGSKVNLHKTFSELWDRLERKGHKEKLGFDCDVYYSQNSKGKLKLFVSNGHLVKRGDLLFKEISFNNKLIISMEYNEGELRIATRLTSLKPTDGHEIDSVLTLSSDPKENVQTISTDSVHVGKPIPCLPFFEIEGNRQKPLCDVVKTKKFLLVEIWGTWCKPCRSASVKLRDFYDQHSKSVDILSLAYKESIPGRVSEIIQKERLFWNHGFATNEINNALNSSNSFPHILLVDEKMNLLFEGNPNDDNDLAAIADMVMSEHTHN